MAGTVNLDPQAGADLAIILAKFANEEMMEVAQLGYAAVECVGDNNCIDAFKERFGKFKDNFDNNVLPALSDLKAAMEEYTDVAEYISKLSIETSVTGSDVGTISAGGFDAARNL